jgi:hypothetical protein
MRAGLLRVRKIQADAGSKLFFITERNGREVTQWDFAVEVG